MPYKKVNISTVRALPEIKAKFEKIVKTLGFSSMAHFFTRSMETLMDQIAAGQKLAWPLRFEQEAKQVPQESTKRPKRPRK